MRRFIVVLVTILAGSPMCGWAQTSPSSVPLSKPNAPTAEAVPAYMRSSLSLNRPDEDARSLTALQQLTRRADVWMVEVPLNGALAWMQEQWRLPFIIDEMSLHDEGIRLDDPVTLRLPHASGFAALEHLLEPLQLGWQAQDGVVHVMTQVKLGEKLETRVYPVGDLMTKHGATYTDLIDMLTTCVAPETWDTVGGPGTVAPLPLRNGGVLVFRQTQAVHFEASALMATLRRASGLNPEPLIRRTSHRSARQIRNEQLRRPPLGGAFFSTAPSDAPVRVAPQAVVTPSTTPTHPATPTWRIPRVHAE